jgi:hypothetical protein
MCWPDLDSKTRQGARPDDAIKGKAAVFAAWHRPARPLDWEQIMKAKPMPLTTLILLLLVVIAAAGLTLAVAFGLGLPMAAVGLVAALGALGLLVMRRK